MLNRLRAFFGSKAEDSSASPTNWSLLIRSDGPDAIEFLEIRQNARAVWSARGKPFTPGERKLRNFSTTGEAESFLLQTIEENQSQGLELVHRGVSIPGELDFELLKKAIYNGAREAYQQMCAQHREEIISGFALFTDSDGMTICPAAMPEACFADRGEEEDYCRTNPYEWPFSTDAGLLLAYRIILVAAHEHYDIPFEVKIPRYFEQFSEACLAALEKLDGDALFGSGVCRDRFLLLFGVSDHGPTKAAVKRLNPPSVYQRYSHCFND